MDLLSHFLYGSHYFAWTGCIVLTLLFVQIHSIWRIAMRRRQRNISIWPVQIITCSTPRPLEQRISIIVHAIWSEYWCVPLSVTVSVSVWFIVSCFPFSREHILYHPESSATFTHRAMYADEGDEAVTTSLTATSSEKERHCFHIHWMRHSSARQSTGQRAKPIVAKTQRSQQHLGSTETTTTTT